MLAWQKFGNGQTPESSGLKGDKLVELLCCFDKAYKEEIAQLMSAGKQKKKKQKTSANYSGPKKCLKCW
jgi:arginyl-tRNA synthetase